MPTNHVAENVFGTIGTICWTLQIIPQLWKSWRSKSTEGLSASLVLIWGLSGVFLGTYAVVQNLNIPLIIQPQLFGALCMVSWIQCMHYGYKKSSSWCAAVLILLLAISGGVEVGLVYAVRTPFERGEDGAKRATQFFGIISSIMIAVGLLPQYHDIYKRREVVGLSLLFISVDMAGGIFNDLSLVFKGEFDIIASITYSVVVVMDAIIVVAALILNPIARRRRAASDAEGQAAETRSAAAHLEDEFGHVESACADAQPSSSQSTELKDRVSGSADAIAEERRTTSSEQEKSAE